MKFPDGLASFGLYLLLPIAIGALSGYIGVHLLFGLVKAIEKWRGRRAAIALTGLIFGILAFVFLVSPILMEGVISGLIVGLLGLGTGAIFALGVFKKSKFLTAVTGSLLGFSIGAFANLLLAFLVFRPTQGAENYLLIVPLLIFVTVGGFSGLISSGARVLVELR